jgi:hypothetical protein
MNAPFKTPTNTGVSSAKSASTCETILAMAKSISWAEINGTNCLSQLYHYFRFKIMGKDTEFGFAN